MGYLDNAGLSRFTAWVKSRLSGKQDKLTGTESQVVGFDAAGDAVPVPAPEGLTPYDYAVQGGFTGTEEQFLAQLNGGPYLPLSGEKEMNGTLKLQPKTGTSNPIIKSSIPGTSGITRAVFNFFGYKNYGTGAGIYLSLDNGMVDSNLAYTDAILSGVATPSSKNHAANKGYVDSAIQTAIEGDIDAKTAEKLLTPRNIRINLASDANGSFDGTADVVPGVTGTLPVSKGGTGQTSMTDTAYTTTKYRGISFATSTPSSVTNGCVVLVYV